MRAAAKGHAETIRLLLQHEGRSDPNARGGERLKARPHSISPRSLDIHRVSRRCLPAVLMPMRHSRRWG